MRYGLIPVICTLFTVSCGSWPQVDTPSRAQNTVWPKLLPLDQITGASPAASSAPAEAQRLSARAANLRARAQIMRQSVADEEAFEALRARLAR